MFPKTTKPRRGEFVEKRMDNKFNRRLKSIPVELIEMFKKSTIKKKIQRIPTRSKLRFLHLCTSKNISPWNAKCRGKNRANNTSPLQLIIPSVLAFSLILVYFHCSRGNFDLVVGGPFDQGPSQETLRNWIAWSGLTRLIKPYVNIVLVTNTRLCFSLFLSFSRSRRMEEANKPVETATRK